MSKHLISYRAAYRTREEARKMVKILKDQGHNARIIKDPSPSITHRWLVVDERDYR